METGKLKSTRGGVQLALAWDVPAVEPRGIIQIVHGMCEHKERYFPLMEFLRDKGFVVVAHDHRGHGASVEKKEDLGYMGKDGWLGLIDDTKAVTDWVKARFSGLPLTLFGHSMGSLVVRSYAKRYDGAIDSLIVCGCPSDNPVKGAGMAICRSECAACLMPASVRAESTTPCFPTESRYASPSASGPVYCERATPASVPNHCEKCRFAHSAADAPPHST